MERNNKKLELYNNYIKDLNEVIEFVESELEKQKKSILKTRYIRPLQHIKKELLSLHKKTHKLVGLKQKRKVKEDYISGLDKKQKISEELANFLQEDPNIKLSRNDVRNAIYVYINIKENESRISMLKWAKLNPNKLRNLRDPTDGRKIIPDEKLSTLLRYEQYKNDVLNGDVYKKDKKTKIEDCGMYNYVVIKLLGIHFCK